MGNNTVLMSSPEYFKVEYSINPWMIEGVEVDLELAKQQWANLKSTIEEAGAVFLQQLSWGEANAVAVAYEDEVRHQPPVVVGLACFGHLTQ